MTRFLVGDRNQILIAQEGEEAENQGEGDEGQGDPVEANAPSLHCRDLTVPGETPESEKGREQYPVRQGPLEDYLGYFVEDVFEDQIKGGLILCDGIHFLKEEDDGIDEDQGSQT
jgi:hypothetical protein